MKTYPPAFEYPPPPPKKVRRFSTMAGMALGAAIVMNPFVIKEFFGGPHADIPVIFILMALPVLLALIASIRIIASQRQLRGLPIAIIALTISLFWWGDVAFMGMALAAFGR